MPTIQTVFFDPGLMICVLKFYFVSLLCDDLTRNLSANYNPKYVRTCRDTVHKTNNMYSYFLIDVSFAFPIIYYPYSYSLTTSGVVPQQSAHNKSTTVRSWRHTTVQIIQACISHVGFTAACWIYIYFHHHHQQQQGRYCVEIKSKNRFPWD